MPLEACPKHQSTIETFGAEEVYDATGTSSDTKRFATLNLFSPMKLLEDESNYVKCHVVFSGKFQTADEWHDQEERQLWDPDVVVSFQENAWVDTPTHIHGLREVLGPMNDHPLLADTDMQGITIEDNMSTHLTEATLNYWANELTNLSPAKTIACKYD